VSPRTRSLASVLLVVGLAAACTGGDGGDGNDDGGTGPTAPASAPPTVDQGPVEFVPGAFRYEFGGVTAELTLDGDAAGTLDVTNASGAELDAPSIYVIAGDDTRHDASIDPTAVIPDGDEATFEVSFVDPLDVARLGLVILEFGESNYGAFAPVIADQG
jgi:hypothetical protein